MKMTDLQVLEFAARVRYTYLFIMKYADNLASASVLEAGYRANIATDDDKMLRELLAERAAVVQRLHAFKQELKRLLKLEDDDQAFNRAWLVTTEFEAYTNHKAARLAKSTEAYDTWLTNLRFLLPYEPPLQEAPPTPSVDTSPLMPRPSGVLQ